MRIRDVVIILSSAWLAACGINALRVESAGDIARYASAVSTQTGTILKDAEARREKAFLTMIASDTSCEPVQPVLIHVPLGPPRPGDKTPLCAQTGAPPPAGYTVEALDFRPIATEAIQPTLDLAGAVAAYGEAMAKIVEQPKIDTAKQIDEILKLADKAHAMAESFGIEGVSGLPELTAAQKATAAKLIDFIRELEREQRQVKDIRKLYAEKADEVGALLPELASQVDTWVTVVAVGADQVTATNLARAYRNERTRLSLEGRTAMIQLVRDAQQQPERTAKAATAFKNAVRKLEAENRQLGRLLTAPSDADRIKAARISQQRIMEALGLIANALSAWKVI